ncbi:MAG: hypothetical protein KJP16_13890, partial [Gammaproteobacteria bacterium]|nr:hypothetical protein [Gammaproteobacteria bacterium]NNL51898.1 hypothetical protein [Woeseiaceae bacterium]
MPRFVGPLLTIALLAACQQAPESPPPESKEARKVMAIRCGTLIDGLANEPLGERLVVINGDRIASVLNPDSTPPVGAEIVDLSEYTCLPGLIDTHTHLALVHDDANDLTVYYRRPMAETLAMTERNTRITLDAGFTTVR